MTVYISASTRPSWSQTMGGLIDPATLPRVEKRLRDIAEGELTRTRVQQFQVIAIDDALHRVTIHCDRATLFTVEYRIT